MLHFSFELSLNKTILVKRNIAANLIGGVLIAALTVIITPLQVNLLGMASYGVVGFITALQIAFTAFDLGLSSTVTRELAIDKTKNKDGSTQLLRTAHTIFWIVAALIGSLIFLFSGEIAQRWFTAQTIDISLIEQSLQVIALYLALRWPVSLYTGVLIGLQRMDVLNTVKVGTASLRLIGGVFVLLHWRTLNAFLIWTAINALIEVISFWLICRWVHPSLPWRPGISLADVRRVWRFSLTMNGLAIITILVVQADRLLVSRLLPLEALGAYTLAYTAAAIMPALIGAVSTAVLPYLTQAYGETDRNILLRRYDTASRFMMFVTGLVAGSFVFFGEHLLALWVNPSAAAEAAMSLALLATGFFGSAAASNAYQLTIASGRANLALRISTLTALPYAAALYVLISWLGISGAALAWLLLNFVYVVFLVPKVHCEILHTPSNHYLLRILIPFSLLTCCTFGLARLIMDTNSLTTLMNSAIFCLTLIVYTLLGYFLLGHELKASIRTKLHQLKRLGESKVSS